MKKSFVFNNIIDYILVILLVILSISKGGFYKSDILIFSVGISIITFIYTSIDIYLCIRKKEYKIDIIQILLFLLPISYILPIIFNNYADLNSSIFETIRYLNLYCIYSIVKKSKKKEIYIYSIICITIMQCVLSIDAIGNRYLEKILTRIGSGYLDIDLNRMSGTLQYANVLAILCLISSVFIFDYLKKENKTLKQLIYFILMFILSTTIILTGSRTVIIFALFSFIVLLFVNKKIILKNIFIYLPMFILIGIYTSLIYTAMASKKVYYIFVSFLILSGIISFLINKFYNIYIKKIKFKIKKTHIICFITLVILLYFILSLNITKALYISEGSNDSNNVIILNNIENEINEIRFKVKSNESHTRYKINLNSVDNNNVEINIREFNYTENTSGNFKYEFELNNDIKYLKVYIKCEKGSIVIDNLYLNNNKQKLDYVFISRNLIYRFEDLIYGSTSATDRLTYYCDAIKIICKSVPNFVFGTGGEGFNNIYGQVKTRNYYSTEVHNSFLQIFVESGIIGFSLIISILIYTLVNTKNNFVKFAYLLLTFHSFIDLNFSYMFMIAVFGILLALLDFDKKLEINNRYLNISLFILSLVCILFSFIILIKTILAMYIYIPIYKEENINLKNQIEVINKNEKRVMLDPYEYKYKKELDNQYNIYLDLLYEKVKSETNEEKISIINEEIKNVLNNIILNANEILKNNKYNPNQILYSCNIYFKNINNLSNIYYDDNLIEGYTEYMNFINIKLNYLKVLYQNNMEVIEKIDCVEKEYKHKLNQILN